MDAALAELLTDFGLSLVLTTGRGGEVLLVRADERGGGPRTLSFETPTGIAVRPDRFALATGRQVLDYRSQPAVVARLAPPDRHDTCFVPRAAHWTGAIGATELAWAGDRLWVVSSAFSCLATLDADHSFRPEWRPPFVSSLAPEDRCHLNGIAVRDGAVRYATALGRSDAPQGWRDGAAGGGVLLEVPGGEVLAAGLALPHSPRWHDGRLWMLESGAGELGTVDPASGERTVVATVPGFARGLALAGRYAFVGVSPGADGAGSGCGLDVVDTRAGGTVASLRFGSSVAEIADVQLVPFRFPEILEPDAPLTATSFVLPVETLADVAR